MIAESFALPSLSRPFLMQSSWRMFKRGIQGARKCLRRRFLSNKSGDEELREIEKKLGGSSVKGESLEAVQARGVLGPPPSYIITITTCSVGFLSFLTIHSCHLALPTFFS